MIFKDLKKWKGYNPSILSFQEIKEAYNSIQEIEETKKRLASEEEDLKERREIFKKEYENFKADLLEESERYRSYLDQTYNENLIKTEKKRREYESNLKNIKEEVNKFKECKDIIKLPDLIWKTSLASYEDLDEETKNSLKIQFYDVVFDKINLVLNRKFQESNGLELKEEIELYLLTKDKNLL